MKRTISLILLAMLWLTTACNLFTFPGNPTSQRPGNPTPGPADNRTSSPVGSPMASPSGKPTGEAAGSASVFAKWDYVLHENPNPINLKVTLETGSAVTATIPISGGQLTVTGGDGTAFTLEIPSDALTATTEIEMTPVKSVGGLPFKGQGALAVQIEPSGLQLDNWATLTITPAQAIPADQQIFFGYHGDGQSLFLAPPAAPGQALSLKLLHFSGYGVDKGFLADLGPVREQLGGAVEDRLVSLLAEKLALDHQKAVANPDDNSPASVDMAKFTDYFYDQVIKPRLAAAGESCAAGRLATETLLTWERMRQLYGISDGSEPPRPEEVGLGEKVLQQCLKEEYELCRDQHIVQRIIPVALAMERHLALLGSSNPALSQLADSYIDKCLRFDLVFESDATMGDSRGGFESKVKATVPLRFSGDPAWPVTGKSALVNTSFEYHMTKCKITSTRGGAEFNAQKLKWDYVVTKSNPEGVISDLTLMYFPGFTTESFSLLCKPAYTSPPMPLWTSAYLATHQDTLNGLDASVSVNPGNSVGSGGFPDLSGLPQPGSAEAASLSFEATGWEIKNGEYFAKLEWTKENKQYKVVEAGTFKLYHRPG